MDDGVTDYPSFGGLDLMATADTEFDFVTVETEYGTLHYGGCVQNCQDPARWMVGTIDTGIYRGLGPNASSVRTANGLVVAYEDGQTGTNRIKVGVCGGACYFKGNWRVGDVRAGFLGSFRGTHSRALAAGPAGDLSLLYRGGSGGNISYAACASSCTDSASWRSVSLDSGGFFEDDVGLTVAPSGTVHALVEGVGTDSAVTYFTCDSACTSSANWSSLLLATGAGGGTPSILVGPSGTLYAAYGGDHTSGSVPVTFATCAGGCLTLGNWSFAQLPAAAGNDVSLLLDASEHPWLATSYGIRGKTVVLHCMAACGVASSWTQTTIDSLGDGLDISMVLDAQNQPRIVVSGNGVHYAQRPDTTVLAH
jgi:hypothetical protein